MKLSLRNAAGTFAAGVATTFLVSACGSDRREFVDPDQQGMLGSDASTELDANVPCISDTLKAQPVPLAMLIVIDRSGSMATNNKWDVARNAMIAFADTPEAAGSKLGLSIFPPDDSASCTVSSFAPIVPIALLPGNGTPIKDALLSRPTTGSTPMTPALQAGTDAMKAHIAANPNDEGVLILVTDGVPGGCSSTESNVTSTISAAKSGTPSIRTFVVGMDGADFGKLDAFAVAGGGAPKAFNASANPDAGSPQKPLLDALEAVRSGALGCEYILPAPPPDQGVLDPTTVEIEFTPGGNDPQQKFKHVANAAACGATSGGFYYDDPVKPKRIILCPASCEDVKEAPPQAKVNVFLGCIKKVN
jgi:hypothetical protein